MPRLAREITRFSKKEIDTLFKFAHRNIKKSGLTILVGPRQKNFARILIIASRKVGNAPERNKIRRQLKSIFYEKKLYLQLQDCIIIVYKQATELSFIQLQLLLLSAYGKKNSSH